MSFIVEIIQAILIIISAILIIIAAIGIIRLDNQMDNVFYARLHIFGILDVACILAAIGLGQYLIAVLYFIITPFVAHSISNAYFYSEDKINKREDKENV